MSYSPFSRSILAVRSAGQGVAKRSGRSASQKAVSAMMVAFCVKTSGFTASSASAAEWCVYL